MTDEIIQTELFQICFAKDRKGRDNRKFKPEEQKKILESVKCTEEIISKILSFSLTSPRGEIYRVPIIFEKISQEKVRKNHQNHFAMLAYPPIGTMWNATVKFEGIEIRSHTSIISLCPVAGTDLFETISHEITHAFINSFFEERGVNFSNLTYLLEGITEWMTKLTSIKYKKI